jgi:TetR/AcrR family transcriptional repressor of nem operon
VKEEVTVAARRAADTDTASAILDVAEQLVPTRGFKAFSYADVAAALGITKPALRYHFPGKAELGHALLDRYTDRWSQALEALDAHDSDAATRLAAYADLYAQVLAQHRMCLCGRLAANYHTFPGPTRQAVITFFDQQREVAGRPHRSEEKRGDVAD